VRRLLVSGATIDLKNFDGETALHIACFQGDLETVKAILKPISPTEVIEANLDHYMPQIHGSNMITLMHDMNYEGEQRSQSKKFGQNSYLLLFLFQDKHAFILHPQPAIVDSLNT
jgi:ankyrin repeat protein